MTTKLTIKNSAMSNGDVNVANVCGSSVNRNVLTPGQSTELWVATANDLTIRETWPSAALAGDQAKAGETADNLIAAEFGIQDKMWGDANERADAVGNQLMSAGLAQIVLVQRKLAGDPSDEAVKLAQEFYPPDWNGFRDYGSNVANLVVAAAFLRSEIKRRILLGEDTTRAKRGEAYKGPDFPYVSSDEAAKSLN